MCLDLKRFFFFFNGYVQLEFNDKSLYTKNISKQRQYVSVISNNLLPNIFYNIFILLL